MNKLSAPINQLVERKLWPLALLLLAALAAVPVLLAKSSEPTAVTAAPAATTATTTPAVGEPVVALADASRTDRKRTVLGSAKDPFEPARAPRAKKSSTKGSTTTVSPGTSPAPSSSGTSGGSGLPTTQPPAVLAPTAPKKTYEIYSLMVRFGDSAMSPLPKGNLKRLTSLPSVEDAVVIYLGLMKDRRTAVFLVDAAAVVQGDGVCNPSPSNCQTLHLKKGETAFFDVSNEQGVLTQYQLDVVKVVTRRTTNAKAARRSRRATAKGGREALRARVSRVGDHRYDARTGTVKRTSSAD